VDHSVIGACSHCRVLPHKRKPALHPKDLYDVCVRTFIEQKRPNAQPASGWLILELESDVGGQGFTIR
jgi:hypothetical protein